MTSGTFCEDTLAAFLARFTGMQIVAVDQHPDDDAGVVLTLGPVGRMSRSYVDVTHSAYGPRGRELREGCRILTALAASKFDDGSAA